MVARLVPILLVVALLAGCSDKGGNADSLSAAEQAARDLDVEATSSTGIIRGVVVDTAITPVAGVTVSIANLNRSTTTNELGAFAFEGLEPGTYFLSTSHANYTSVQQAVDVVAGDQSPEPVRIQVQAIPRGTPLVVPYQATIFVDSSIIVLGFGYTLGGVTTDNSYYFEVPIEPNATVAQTEIVWEAGTPLAENVDIGGGTYNGNDGIDTASRTGPAPMVFRANGTADGKSADNVYYNIFAGDSAGAPGGVISNQKFDCYIHVFYNFVPDAGWQFGRDGEYPTPGK